MPKSKPQSNARLGSKGDSKTRHKLGTKSKSLDILLNRTLGSRASRATVRARKIKGTSRLNKNPPQAHSKEPVSEYETEIRDLKEQIASKLVEKVIWNKKSRRDDGSSFFGLPAGLAPLDYDLSESSDEEPY